MTEIAFVETRQQASQMKSAYPPGGNRLIIAMTAEALEALEHLDVPHKPISAYASLHALAAAEEQMVRDCFAVAAEIESHIAERCPPAHLEGPGFLRAQVYYIQFTAAMLAARAYLMREAIAACSPHQVTLFDGQVDSWFQEYEYDRNPWIDVLAQMAEDSTWQLRVIEARTEEGESTPLPGKTPDHRLPALRNFLKRVGNKVNLLLDSGEDGQIPRHNPAISRNLSGLRLLFALPSYNYSAHYDWAPVLDALQSIGNDHCFALVAPPHKGRYWARYFSPKIYSMQDGPEHTLPAGSPEPDPLESRAIGELFDRWLAERAQPPRLDVLGIDLFPTLARQFRVVTMNSPALTRSIDAVAQQALATTRPHAVCLFGMAWLAAKQLAYRARQRGIPVLCYQHGGSYGTHIWPPHEDIEFSHADYFLTYGSGIQPRTNPLFPVTAHFVPVGSARLDQIRSETIRSHRRRGRNLNILWIGGLATRNTLGATYSHEDTHRYLAVKAWMEAAGHSPHVTITYRPSPGSIQSDGIAQWLERTDLPTTRVDWSESVTRQIRASDLVITDSTSGTVWNEVLALGKPLIIYCDPRQTLLMAEFAAELERAALWCKTDEDLQATAHRLADDTERLLADLQRIDPLRFLEKYILHRMDGGSVRRVLTFLAEIYANQTMRDKIEDVNSA